MPKRVSLTPDLRRLRARQAAYALHAGIDSKAHTEPARAAFLNRFEAEVDPEGSLPEAERLRRAECAKKAHFTRLAYRSAIVRSQRTGRSRIPDRPAEENPTA